MFATCPPSASSGYQAEFREVCYQKHNNQLNCRTSSSDISGLTDQISIGNTNSTEEILRVVVTGNVSTG
jgi:hypothetical protein